MFKTTGFVIKKNGYREFDRIYTVYTSDFGKISLLVRGAKKIKSKLAPNLEHFGELRLNFAKGKVFNHLSGINVLDSYRFILKDNEKINLAVNCSCLLDKFIKPEERDAQIYRLLKSALGAVNNASSFNILQKIQVYFFWRLVGFLGYRPQLDGCALCGRHSRVPDSIGGRNPAPELLTKFNITDNIIICSECVGDGLLIKEETLANLRKIFEVNLEKFLKDDLDNALIAITEKARQIKLSEL